MKQNYTIIIEKGSDGFLTSEVVELPGCHTQVKTMDELIIRSKEAIGLFLECADENTEFRRNFVGLQTIAV
jgi:predicted RNase H-like HicB family nuclease